MCRMLVVRSEREFMIEEHLRSLASIAKNSKEYQGHGWGCAYPDGRGSWNVYRNVMPIWEDDLSRFRRTKLLVAHARSAFEDMGISVENNMPFVSGRRIFIFNGELRGVRLREEGRIGAEKIFNFINRMDDGDLKSAIEKGVRIIASRTRRLRGMNLIVVEGRKIYLSSMFNEDGEYYTMHIKRADPLIICSEPYSEGWEAISNGTIEVFG